jgi:hypothetical protein
MQYLFIGIILGIIIEKYVFPFIDTIFEVFTYKISVHATEYKVQSETMAKEFELKYPEVEESATNVIGYQYDDSPDKYYYEEDDDIDDCKNKIGFRIK